jgi:hypothetical protein
VTDTLAARLYGWRTDKPLVPNCADIDSAQSSVISEALLRFLAISPGAPPPPKNPGDQLEILVAEQLQDALPNLDPKRQWVSSKGKSIEHYEQYRHLKTIDTLVAENPTLRTTLGRDYRIKPDVTVALSRQQPTGSPFLHAAISCKWTIRSDRVQNVRHEFNQMSRHRRGRQPHLVTVTAEPLPSRLVSIARGTGEVDAIYHIAFDAMNYAVLAVGNAEQKSAWEECVQQQRILPYSTLANTLATW